MNDEFPRHCWQNKISFTIPKNVAVTVWTNLTLLIFQSWRQNENNKTTLFYLALPFVAIYKCIDISFWLFCVCQYFFWKCLFLYIQYSKHDNITLFPHNLSEDHLISSLSLTPSLDIISDDPVTWPHSLGWHWAGVSRNMMRPEVRNVLRGSCALR